MEQLDIAKEITLGRENARREYELYQLLSTYNAYSELLLKAKGETKPSILRFDLYSHCYRNQINDLFSLFKSDECLKTCFISPHNDERDMLFLIDENTILRLNYLDVVNSIIPNSTIPNYFILKCSNAIAKVYSQNVYCGDPYYCDEHWEEKEAFGIFENNSLITPSYALTSELEKYNNIDIRDILKIQPIEEIYEKINEAKNIKTKTLMLKK